MENAEKIVLEGQGKFIVLRYLPIVLLGLPAMIFSACYLHRLQLPFGFSRSMNIFFISLFVLAFILSFARSRRTRTIEITKDYIKFPKPLFGKGTFSRREIKGINIIIPWFWKIGRYFGAAAWVRVFYTDNETVKGVSQAFYEDFDPEELVKALREFNYNVHELGPGEKYINYLKWEEK